MRHRYLLYAEGEDIRRLGLSDVPNGAYRLSWLDPASGYRLEQEVEGPSVWAVPKQFQTDDVALSVTPITQKPTRSIPESWEWIDPQDAGIDKAALSTFAARVGGNGCVARFGRLAHCWGDTHKRDDWGSVSKSIFTTLLFHAVATNRVFSIYDRIPDPASKLTGKDQQITWWNLVNMNSGYARSEAPGAAWSYNDIAITLFARTLEGVFHRPLDNIALELFAPLNLKNGQVFGSRDGLGVNVSVPDMMKIAQLWLNMGEWNARQVIPRWMFDEYLRPQVQPDLPQSTAETKDYIGVGSYGGPSYQVEDGPGYYGSNWWFNSPILAVQNSDVLPLAWDTLPPDAYMASGHWGREGVLVVPSMELIVAWRSDKKWPREQFNLGKDDDLIARSMDVLFKGISGATRVQSKKTSQSP